MIAKAFDLSKRVEDSDEIQEEEARIREGGSSHSPWVPAGESGDDLSDSETDGEGDGEEDGKGTMRNAMVKLATLVPRNTLNPPQKPSATHIMGGFIRLYCVVVLAVIKSVSIRWNIVLAEFRRALLLRPAFDHWVSTLDTGKTGKARRVAQRQKQKWAMSDIEWTVVEDLAQILEASSNISSIAIHTNPFEPATLSFSKNGKVHLPDVLPTFVQLHTELQNSQIRIQKAYSHGRDLYVLLKAISAGQEKLEKYFELARGSHLPLIASTLEAGTPRDNSSHSQKPIRPKLKSSWSDKLRLLSSVSNNEALDDELVRFFGNVYAYRPGMDILQWWKVH
ncbi:hypothetical protein FRC10_005036 [Ceratobasidium sp. 414]|nr:hypothetical protein FRC10_005036 [Ceratobasidium sp. 414]